MSRRKVWLAIVLAGAGWGSEGVGTRLAFEAGAGPYTVATWRAFVSGLAILIWAGATRRTIHLNRVILRQGVVQGAAHLAAPYLLLTLAYENASAGFVSLFITLVPLATAALAHVLLDNERMTGSLFWGMAIALGGVAFMVLSGDSGLGNEGRPLVASGLALGAVILIAWSSIYAKRDADNYDVFSLTVAQMVIGALMLAIVMPFTPGSIGDLNREVWLLILFLAVFGSIIPYGAFFWALQHARANLVALSGYVPPFVATIGGVLLLDEQLEAGVVIGGSLILVGVFAANRAEANVASGTHL